MISLIRDLSCAVESGDVAAIHLACDALARGDWATQAPDHRRIEETGSELDALSSRLAVLSAGATRRAQRLRGAPLTYQIR